MALRLAALAGPPTLSDDLFRYAWDGHVQVTGVDPYRYAPDDPALESLRDPWLWPPSPHCPVVARPPDCTRINRPMVHTIYPPAAEAWFTAVFRLSGLGARHKAWQIAGLATEVAVLAMLPLALPRLGRDERWTALYALSPAPVVDIVTNGHVDGLAVALLVAALALAGRWRDRPTRAAVAAGALLGAAALVKLYPLVLVAGLAGLRTGPAPQREIRGDRVLRAGRVLRGGPVFWGGLAALTVMAIGYLPHVLAVGPKVLGYLPGYLREERYAGGGRFLLVTLFTGRGPQATVAAVLCGAALVAWVLRRRPPPPAAFAVLLGGLLLIATPAQSWYSVALLAAATVAVQPAWAVLVAAAYPYFVAVVLAEPYATLVGRIGAGVGLSAVAVAVVVGHRRRASAEVGATGRSSANRKGLTVGSDAVGP